MSDLTDAPDDDEEPSIDLDEFEEAVRRVLTHDEADPEDT